MRAYRVLAAIGILVGMFMIGSQPVQAGHVSNHVNDKGWSFSYRVTATDGLRVYEVKYNGKWVLWTAQIPQCSVDYDNDPSDMEDQLGTSGNIPYVSGSLRVSRAVDYVAVTATFQCCGWPQSGSYRYKVQYRFYTDGRFRPMVLVYGPGIWPTAQYRCHFRMDTDILGPSGDVVRKYGTTSWGNSLSTEHNYPDDGTNDNGGAEWNVWESTDGRGYYINPRGVDNRPKMFVLRYVSTEEPPYSSPTFPATFDNNQNINGQDDILWYVTHFNYSRPPGCPSQGAAACTYTRVGPIFRPSAGW